MKPLVPVTQTSKTVLKAALLNPRNLVVLVVGVVSGVVFSSPLLIPVGCVAYSALCYLDLSNEKFVQKVLDAHRPNSKTVSSSHPMGLFAAHQPDSPFIVEELHHLHRNILRSQEKIRQLFRDADDFTRELLGEFAQTESLVTKSTQFLTKAQGIREYLESEDEQQIRQDMEHLQEKITRVSDTFSKHQYQQARHARQKQLETLQELQQMYERLVSQVTNISLSLESMYSRMVKMKTLDYSLASAEGDHVASLLNDIVQEVEQLDSALKESESLSYTP